MRHYQSTYVQTKRVNLKSEETPSLGEWENKQSTTDHDTLNIYDYTLNYINNWVVVIFGYEEVVTLT